MPETRAGVVAAEAIPELAEELRLRPGNTLLDLACGWAAYGLLVAKETEASLIGVDFSVQALAEAREQAARMGVGNASFRSGELTATGLPDASVEAVLCTDAIQFPDEPAIAYDEIRRVLKPGSRVALTCWEPVDRANELLPHGYAGRTSPTACGRRAPRTLRCTTVLPGWRASTRCGERPTRSILARTPRCGPSMTKP